MTANECHAMEIAYCVHTHMCTMSSQPPFLS